METPFTETFVELIDSPSAPLAAMFFDDNPLCYISSVISFLHQYRLCQCLLCGTFFPPLILS